MSSEKRAMIPYTFDNDVPPLKSGPGSDVAANNWPSVQQTQKSFSTMAGAPTPIRAAVS